MRKPDGGRRPAWRSGLGKEPGDAPGEGAHPWAFGRTEAASPQRSKGNPFRYQPTRPSAIW